MGGISIALALLGWLFAAPAFAQSTGTLAPVARQQFLDNSGNPCSGCLLYTYTAGTTTLASVYTDLSLSIAHANPIVLDSAGRPTSNIYLPASNFKFVLRTSGGSTLWTADNVGAVPNTTVASSFNSTCDGRLTLTSATGVTTSDVTAATTVYFTPYKGNRCALYDGSSWNISSFTELSIALGTDAANTNYDVFLYLNSGTPTLERVAWSSATARATAISLQNGVYVKSSDTSHRYVGTYRTTATIGQTEDSASKRFVWNYYNRVRRTLRRQESTDSWTYTTGTLRQANNSTSNQVAVVVGVADAELSLRVVAFASNSGGAVLVAVSIGVDSTTTGDTAIVGLGAGTSPTASSVSPAVAHLETYPAIGYHFFAWLETSTASGTTTWYGDNGVPAALQSGMTGFIEG